MTAYPICLSTEQWADIGAHLSAELPNEACGLLAGCDGQTYKVYLIPNAQPSPTRYEMEPGELIRAILEIETQGWTLIGIFHSHPTGPSVPSATDIAEAYYPDSAYIICSPAAAGWQARAFHIRAGQVQEIPVCVGAL